MVNAYTQNTRKKQIFKGNANRTWETGTVTCLLRPPNPCISGTARLVLSITPGRREQSLRHQQTSVLLIKGINKSSHKIKYEGFMLRDNLVIRMPTFFSTKEYAFKLRHRNQNNQNGRNATGWKIACEKHLSIECIATNYRFLRQVVEE